VWIALPQRGIAHIDGIHVAIEGDHAWPAADAAQQIAHRIHAYLVVIQPLHFFADALDDRPFLAAERGNADNILHEFQDIGLERLCAVIISRIHGALSPSIIRQAGRIIESADQPVPFIHHFA
jgi:hypothetical protein